jgi:hypothetical protein
MVNFLLVLLIKSVQRREFKQVPMVRRVGDGAHFVALVVGSKGVRNTPKASGSGAFALDQTFDYRIWGGLRLTPELFRFCLFAVRLFNASGAVRRVGSANEDAAALFASYLNLNLLSCVWHRFSFLSRVMLPSIRQRLWSSLAVDWSSACSARR